MVTDFSFSFLVTFARHVGCEMFSPQCGTTAHRLLVLGILQTLTDQPRDESLGQCARLQTRLNLPHVGLTLMILWIESASNSCIAMTWLTHLPWIEQLNSSDQDDELLMPVSKKKFLACVFLTDAGEALLMGDRRDLVDRTLAVSLRSS